MQAVRLTPSPRSRRGAVLVLMTFLFPVVLAIGFLSVNVAYMLLLRTELRVATDAAARAAGATYSASNDEAAAIEQQRREAAAREHLAFQHAQAPSMAGEANESESEDPAIPQTYTREQPKVGRNEPCHCGSGKKYKHCHGKL